MWDEFSKTYVKTNMQYLIDSEKGKRTAENKYRISLAYNPEVRIGPVHGRKFRKKSDLGMETLHFFENCLLPFIVFHIEQCFL